MSRRAVRWGVLGLTLAAIAALVSYWDDLVEKRVAEVVPGRLIRGAWQRPGPLGRILSREKIRTIVTLTAINRDDPKYVAQAEVVARTGVNWVLVPMRGSQATLEQMAQAADLMADPARQPVFFHCVAGHHRTSLAHAAYRIRYQGWSAARAWREVSGLPWARPAAGSDRNDRRLIEAFAAAYRGTGRSPRRADDEASPNPQIESAGRRPAGPRGGRADRLALGNR